MLTSTCQLNTRRGRSQEASFEACFMGEPSSGNPRVLHGRPWGILQDNDTDVFGLKGIKNPAGQRTLRTRHPGGQSLRNPGGATDFRSLPAALSPRSRTNPTPRRQYDILSNQEYNASLNQAGDHRVLTDSLRARAKRKIAFECSSPVCGRIQGSGASDPVAMYAQGPQNSVLPPVGDRKRMTLDGECGGDLLTWEGGQGGAPSPPKTRRMAERELMKNNMTVFYQPKKPFISVNSPRDYNILASHPTYASNAAEAVSKGSGLCETTARVNTRRPARQDSKAVSYEENVMKKPVAGITAGYREPRTFNIISPDADYGGLNLRNR